MLNTNLHKCLELSKEVTELKDIEEMSEQEIRWTFLQWKEGWETLWNQIEERIHHNDIDDDNKHNQLVPVTVLRLFVEEIF